MPINHAFAAAAGFAGGLLTARLLSRSRGPTHILSRFLTQSGAVVPAARRSDFLRRIAPPLDGRHHKGQAGRIGVLGGSVDYAGAPYYAGMAALRVGGELLYLLTAEEATGPIKSYSPELMVSSVYRHSAITADGRPAANAGSRSSGGGSGGGGGGGSSKQLFEEEQDQMVERVVGLFPRLHALVIGPGLGRNERVLAAVARIIVAARAEQLPLIIDADGLWLICQQPELVAGYRRCVLTPNAAEFGRLAKAVSSGGGGSSDPPTTAAELCEALKGPVLLRKGSTDEICRPGFKACDVVKCDATGCPRRPGGLGDFLAGTTAVLVSWAVQAGGAGAGGAAATTAPAAPAPAADDDDDEQRLIDDQDRIVLACDAACAVVRMSCAKAFEVHKRAMVAPDVLDTIGETFEAMCPAAGGPSPSPKL